MTVIRFLKQHRETAKSRMRIDGRQYPVCQRADVHFGNRLALQFEVSPGYQCRPDIGLLIEESLSLVPVLRHWRSLEGDFIVH